MSVDPQDFLKEAHYHTTRVEEIGLRTAISRGYYAAYHQALSVSHHCPDSMLLPEGKGEGNHQKLIRRFRSVPKNFLGKSLAHQIAILLTQGRDLRIRADYHLSETVTTNDARSLIGVAEKIESLTKQLAQQRTEIVSTSRC